MIEMPVFKDEDWYLQQIKDTIVDRRYKNTENDYKVKKNELDKLLGEIICDTDFSIRDETDSLFEKIVLAPFSELKKIHLKLQGNEEEIFLDVMTDENGKEKKVLKDKWKPLDDLYAKLVSNGVNTQLVQQYGIKCCPYCNENYIVNRVKKNGKIYAMAQLDHFYPKDRFPVFAVSLYNLVPSCSTCNHIKSIKEIGLSPHDHSCDFAHMKISYIPNSADWVNDSKEIKLLFDYDDKDIGFKEKMERNLDEMGLISSYNSHIDYAHEIIKKAQIYGKEMRNNLLNDFPELFESDEELIRVIFSNYIEMEDLLKRPLSKLTQDLLKELNII